MNVYKFEMENEEEEVDFEELSKQYPLFFSSSKSLIKEKYYPSQKSPKPITDTPQIFLDYDDYMLDERITNLKPYTEAKSSDNSSKSRSINSRFSSSSGTNTETALSHSALKSSNFSNNKSCSITKKKLPHSEVSKPTKQSQHVSNLNHESDFFHHDLNDHQADLYQNRESTNKFRDFKEAGVQTPKNIIKKKFNAPPPSPPQVTLHSGYPLLFDYQPINPERQQKLKNGTEKIFYKNGDILVRYLSGKEKIYHQNIILTKYKNGDILQEYLDGSTAYRYANTGTIELTLPDHTSIIQYSNGQREKRNPEGETIVKFSDGVFMKVDVDGKWTMVKSKS